MLGQQVVVHYQLVVFAMDRQHAVVLGDLLHHLLQPPGVYLADRSQRIGPAFRRPDVGV